MHISLFIAAVGVSVLSLSACGPKDRTCSEYMEADQNFEIAVRLAGHEKRLTEAAVKRAKQRGNTQEIYRIISRLYRSARRTIQVANVIEAIDSYYNITILELDDANSRGDEDKFFRIANNSIARLLLMKINTAEYKKNRVYLSAYKGPRGKDLKSTLKLVNADRHRC